MATTVNKLLDQARSWLGCKESNGTHKKIIDVYNGHKPLARGYKVKYTDNWCATFVSACAIKCNATDIIPTECSCGKMISLLQKLGVWEENDNITPKPGYIIFYDWDKKDGWPEHVGIVEKVNGNTITVLEGNKNNAVERRTISVGNANIRGYGKPKFISESETKPTATNKNVNVFYRVKTKKHGWLSEVKNLEDYAGYQDSPITDVAIKVDKGSIKYRVHVKGGNWLGWITGYDIKDINKYAGNGKEIDAIQIYYYTPDDIRPYKRAKYKTNYGWQYDTETKNNQDGYAGVLGKNVTKLYLEIV